MAKVTQDEVEALNSVTLGEHYSKEYANLVAADQRQLIGLLLIEIREELVTIRNELIK